jgi:hypothetical protein
VPEADIESRGDQFPATDSGIDGEQSGITFDAVLDVKFMRVNLASARSV